MGPTGYLLIITVTTVSARHTIDGRYFVQSQTDPNHSFDNGYSVQDVDRRNYHSASDVNPNREPAYGDASVRTERPVYDRHEHNSDNTYATESDHVALISEKVDASNNIGNDENPFKLRTNAYPSTNVVVEYSTESIRAHANVEEQNGESIYAVEIGTKEMTRPENNKGINSRLYNHSGPRTSPRGQNHRSMNMDPENRFIPQQPQLDQNNGKPSKTNDDYEANVAFENKNDDKALNPVVESNVRPSLSNRGGEDTVRLPKEKDEEEVAWVWGSEPEPKPKKNDTDTDDLDDRAAFDGSGCATGLVKVMGICVEKH